MLGAPQQGLLSPAAFIEIAEETGLILPVGEWVLKTACLQLVAWAERAETASFGLSVNVSARQLYQHDFIDRVFAILKETGQSAIPQAGAHGKHPGGKYRGYDRQDEYHQGDGGGFSMDDFGTSYSSLSYLKRLPLSQLKIDRSFVRDVLIDSNDASIVQTIIALSQGLGIEVVAEGVESREQKLFLEEHGCLEYQGYLFGKPQPVDQIEHEFGLAKN